MGGNVGQGTASRHPPSPPPSPPTSPVATGGLKPPLEIVTEHQREMGEWNAPLFSASFFFFIIFILQSRLAGGKRGGSNG